MKNQVSCSTAMGARLGRHFVAAATVTAASAFLGTTDASAGVVHRVFNQVVPNNIDGLYINVETGVTGAVASAVAGWDINPYGTSTTAMSWFGATGGGCVMGLGQGGTTSAVANVSANTVISSASTFGNTASSVTAGGWQLNAVNIFGFRFVAADGLTHYGWGKMQIGATMGVRTLLDVGYESTAATPILAGDEGTAPPPPYDACAASNPSAAIGANSLYMASNAADYGITGACSFNMTHANFFSFTPPASGTYTVDTCSSGVDTRLAVLDGCSAGAAVLACNDDFCGTSSRVSFAATGGVKYFIAVGGTTSTALSSPLAVTVTAPTFDSCAVATNGSVGTNLITTNTFLGNLTGVAGCGTGLFNLYKAQYLRFTAPASTSYKVSLCSTSPSADTVMALLTTCGDATSVVACNDDTCGLLSELSFTASGGTTYYIAIGGYSATTTLPATITAAITEVAPPVNPCDPANVQAGVAGDQIVTIDAAYPALTGICTGINANHAKYMSFTAVRDGDYTVATCNTLPLVDTVVAVLTACGDGTSAIGCNDDSTCGAGSSVTFTATAGQSFYFAVGGYFTTISGPVTVTITEPAPPANPSDLNNDGAVNAADLSILLGNWGGSGVGDINGDGVVGAADLAILLGAWG